MITSDCLSENNYNYPIEILLLLMIVLSRLILPLVIVPMFHCVTEVINISTSPQYSYVGFFPLQICEVPIANSYPYSMVLTCEMCRILEMQV